MGNYYKQTYDIAALGSAASPITLTGSYGAARSGTIAVGKAENVVLIVAYTMGSAETSNSIQLKYEFSSDGTVYSRVINSAISSGTTTHTLREDTFSNTQSAGTFDYITIPFTEVNARSMKVWVKETGIGANGGSCYIVAVIGGR